MLDPSRCIEKRWRREDSLHISPWLIPNEHARYAKYRHRCLIHDIESYVRALGIQNYTLFYPDEYADEKCGAQLLVDDIPKGRLFHIINIINTKWKNDWSLVTPLTLANIIITQLQAKQFLCDSILYAVPAIGVDGVRSCLERFKVCNYTEPEGTCVWFGYDISNFDADSRSRLNEEEYEEYVTSENE